MPVVVIRNVIISKTPSLRLRLRISELGQQCIWCVFGARWCVIGA
jgi:hypothetical protein